MTRMEDEVLKCLSMASGMANAQVPDPKRVQFYATVLEAHGVTPEQVEGAFLAHSGKSSFFPQPADLVKAALGDDEIMATKAWEMVRAAIRKHGCMASLQVGDFEGDGRALWALARLSAERVGMMTEGDRAIVAAEFRRLYAVARNENFTLRQLAGRFETENEARGFDATPLALQGRRKEGPLAFEEREKPVLEAREATPEDRARLDDSIRKLKEKSGNFKGVA